MSSTVLSNATIVASDGLRNEAWLAFDESGILELGVSTPPANSVDVDGAFVLPGFVDLHNHGALGHTFGDSPEGSRRAARFHRSAGTTTIIASVSTAPAEVLLERVTVLAELADEGEIDGIHLEGPFLSKDHRGAHDESHLKDPDPALLARLIDAGRGAVRIVTMAPELVGADALVDELTRLGVVVAVGHTSADSLTARAAFDKGARLATHLFNGMPGIHHREPGPIGAALMDDRVAVELIADGHHVDPLVLGLVLRLVGAGRIALVTDSSRATGVGDGEFGNTVVCDGVVRTVDGRSLAGSTLTMSTAVRQALSSGWSLAEAAVSGAGTPARVLGIEGETGMIAAGRTADLVVMDRTLHPRAVYRRGDAVA